MEHYSMFVEIDMGRFPSRVEAKEQSENIRDAILAGFSNAGIRLGEGSVSIFDVEGEWD